MDIPPDIPPDIPLDTAGILRRLGGVAGRQELLRHCTRHALTTAVGSGRIVRARRDRYVLPELPPALVAAAALGGALSHASAAEHHGWSMLLPPATVHVVVPAKAKRRPRAGVTLHFARVPRERVTGAVRTVLDCAATMPFAEALAVADSACRAGDVTPARLVAAATARRGRGRARMLRVARHADPRADNPFESALRAIVIEAGVGGFESQLEIAGDHYARVDLGDRVRRIVLEADGFEHHGTRKALVKDCRRYDELVSRGWLVLRFAWEQVMFEPGWVARMIVATCDLRDPRRRSAARAA